MFRKLNLFSSSVEEWETPTLLGPLEIANLKFSHPFIWGRKQIQFPK
jgi:hypothetical protein